MKNAQGINQDYPWTFYPARAKENEGLEAWKDTTMSHTPRKEADSGIFFVGADRAYSFLKVNAIVFAKKIHEHFQF